MSLSYRDEELAKRIGKEVAEAQRKESYFDSENFEGFLYICKFFFCVGFAIFLSPFLIPLPIFIGIYYKILNRPFTWGDLFFFTWIEFPSAFFGWPLFFFIFGFAGYGVLTDEIQGNGDTITIVIFVSTAILAFCIGFYIWIRRIKDSLSELSEVGVNKRNDN